MDNCCAWCGKEFEHLEEIIKFRQQYFCDEDCLMGELNSEIDSVTYSEQESEGEE